MHMQEDAQSHAGQHVNSAVFEKPARRQLQSTRLPEPPILSVATGFFQKEHQELRKMDGPRPNEELSDAQSMRRVLKFRDGSMSTDEAFVVDEIMDPTGTSAVTVVRPRTDQDVRTKSS